MGGRTHQWWMSFMAGLPPLILSDWATYLHVHVHSRLLLTAVKSPSWTEHTSYAIIRERAFFFTLVTYTCSSIHALLITVLSYSSNRKRSGVEILPWSSWRLSLLHWPTRYSIWYVHVLTYPTPSFMYLFVQACLIQEPYMMCLMYSLNESMHEDERRIIMPHWFSNHQIHTCLSQLQIGPSDDEEASFMRINGVDVLPKREKFEFERSRLLQTATVCYHCLL